MRKQITIVGRGDSWKQCAFDTEEIWGTVTCLYTPGLEDKPFTKVFAFDPVYPEFQVGLDIAKERNIPVVSSFYEYRTEDFPTREIVREFRVSYFKNTASYMLAMAVHWNPYRLWVYGLEQDKTWCYVFQRPWVTFWLGAAYARRIDVRLPKDMLNYQYKGLNLKQILSEEDFAEMEATAGFKIQ